MFACPTPPVDPPSESVEILGCGSVLDGSTHTFTLNDPAPTQGRRYDWRINGVDPASSIAYPDPGWDTLTYAGLPTDGSSVEVCVRYWEADEDATEFRETCCQFTAFTSSGVAETRTFAEIEQAGLVNAVYSDPLYPYSGIAHLAESMLQSDSCYFQLDAAAQTVSCLEDPEPNDPLTLPAPGSGDDRNRLMDFMQANPGREFISPGGTYTISNLPMSFAAKVWDAQFATVSGTEQFVTVTGDDVAFMRCEFDGDSRASTHTAFRIEASADRFTAIRNEIHDFWTVSQGKSGAAFHNRGSLDAYIACNRMTDMINAGGDSTTHRMNPFLWNGGGSARLQNGMIIGNYVDNFQSNGDRDDVDYLTVQSFVEDPLGHLLFAGNTGRDFGKRMVKYMSKGVIALSNDVVWATVNGPLGNRKLLSFLSAQIPCQGEAVGNNNRFTHAADDNYAAIMYITKSTPGFIMDDISFQGNLITTLFDPPNGNSSSDYSGITMRVLSGAAGGSSTVGEATNVRAGNNVFMGPGRFNQHYWFGDGFDLNSGTVDTAGNVFAIAPILQVERA